MLFSRLRSKIFCTYLEFSIFDWRKYPPFFYSWRRNAFYITGTMFPILASVLLDWEQVCHFRVLYNCIFNSKINTIGWAFSSNVNHYRTKKYFLWSMTCECICSDLETVWVISLWFLSIVNEMQQFGDITLRNVEEIRIICLAKKKNYRILELELLLEIVKVHNLFLIPRNYK